MIKMAFTSTIIGGMYEISRGVKEYKQIILYLRLLDGK